VSVGPRGVRTFLVPSLPVSILILLFGWKQADLDIIDQLRTGIEGLLMELSGLLGGNDELITAKDSDLVVIWDLDGQLKGHKRKYLRAG
jgi:hypothetical protein